MKNLIKYAAALCTVFAMNGQTGRLIGDLPVGKDLAVKYWFKCHIPLTIAMTAIVTALRFMGVI